MSDPTSNPEEGQPKRGVTAQFLGKLRQQGTFSPTAPRGSSSKDQTSVYIRKHSIPQLLEDLTSDLAINQPEDPTRHLHRRLGMMLGVDSEEPPEDSTCFLRVHVECSTRRTDGAVAHFLRRSTLDAGTSTMVKGWVDEATSLLQGLVHEALGERMMVDGGAVGEYSMSADGAQESIDLLKEQLRVANSTIEAMSEAAKARGNSPSHAPSSPRFQASPLGRRAESPKGRRGAPLTSSMKPLFEPFLADTTWDKKEGEPGSCSLRIIVGNPARRFLLDRS